MASIFDRLPPKPPAVKFPEVNFKELHRGIGVPIPAGYLPLLSPPPSSSPNSTITPRGPSSGEQSERRRHLDQQRGRREKKDKRRGHPSATPPLRRRTPSPKTPREEPEARRRRQPSNYRWRTKSGVLSKSPCPPPRRRVLSPASRAAEETRQVHAFFTEGLEDGQVVLTREEQDFLVKYLAAHEDDVQEREFVQTLVGQLDWSGCGVALIYELAAWVHAHDGCDRSVVGLLTARLGMEDAVDRMRSIEKEDELVMCRKVIAVSEKRLAGKSGHP